MLNGSKETDILLSKIVDEFSATTGLASVIVDIQGKEISQLSNFTAFCRLMRSSKTYRSLCQKCDLYGGLEAVKSNESSIYKCHAGLIDLSVPIVIENQLSGFFLSGQVLCEDKEDYPYVLPKQTDWHDNKELVNAYKSIPTFTAAKIASSAEILKIISDYYLKTKIEVMQPKKSEKSPLVYAPKPPEARKEIKQALKYIDKNIHNSITLEEVSCHVFLSSFYFSKLFKKEMKINFVDYVILKKMELAKEMLASTQLSIDKVARSLGYRQTSYFCKVFRNQWDTTPKSYRESVK